MENTRLVVRGQGIDNQYESPLGMSCVQRSSFYLQWNKNSDYQIQGTTFDDGSSGYDLLTPEASLFFQGQEFIVKQIVPDYNNGVNSKSIVATHVYNECQWFRKRDVKNGVLTYTPRSIMQFVFDGNPMGFTYEIIGNFDSQQIENFGNVSGMEALSKIIEVWPDSIVFPDNKHIKIYQHDSFVKNRGHRLGYLYNSSEVKLTYDSTNVSNQVWCIGKAKDKAEGAPDDAPTEYYFDPFMVTDDASVQKWTKGVPHEIATISDERFTDANSMKQYALKQLSPEPALTIEVNTMLYDQPVPGDLTHLEIRNEGLSTDVEIVGYQWYPFDISQPAQVTLNNTAKTIFDYQNNLRNKIYKDMFNRMTAVNSDIAYLNDQNKITGQSIKDLADKIKNLQPNDWNAGSIFIDTSSNNGNLSVETMQEFKNKGAKGIICKLTEGPDYTNPTFESHKSNATNAGLKFIGAYHLFHGDPVNEANYFLSQLQSHNVDKNVLVIADIEDTQTSTLSKDKNVLTNQLNQFYQILNSAGYNNTCDYASSSWFTSRFEQQGKYSWVADYSNHPNKCDAWQFSENWNGLKIDASYSYNPIFV